MPDPILASLPPASVHKPPAAAPAVTKDETAKEERGFFDRMWGKDGFSFGALLDIINPLQHIPVVGTVYRAITGDEIGPAARIAGGALFGGVIGLIASGVDTLVEEETGKDLGEHMLALRGDGDAPADPTTPTGRPDSDGVLYAGNFTAPGTIPDNLAAAPAAPIQMASAAEDIAPELARAAPVAARHEAANGAGGHAVPFATTVNRAGRAPVNLPTPQSLAADPALLREMRDTRAGLAKSPRSSANADTAIATNSQAVAPATFLDYLPKSPPILGESDGPDKAAESGAPAVAASAVPEVPADLIARMNAALEKYQTMQRVTATPGVNITQ